MLRLMRDRKLKVEHELEMLLYHRCPKLTLGAISWLLANYDRLVCLEQALFFLNDFFTYVLLWKWLRNSSSCIFSSF